MDKDQPAAATVRPYSFWREEWLNLVSFTGLGLFGLLEQRNEGQFRVFMLPGWPTYGVLLLLYLGTLWYKSNERRRGRV